jgi:FAD/FMN-containing dehydrogenase
MSIPIVPSGGRTGLSGGAVARKGELILSLNRMNRMHAVDTLARSVRVQAGSTTESVHQHCAEHGLTWPIQLASKGSCQIGGNLSTNAGGLNVVRYGMARRWVLGLQIVSARGEVIELNGEIEKNNAGYDLIQLLIGSEGSLAIITEAVLKLAPLPKESVVFFFACADLFKAVHVCFESKQRGFPVIALEFFSAACLESVEKALGKKCRLATRAGYYVLVEVEGNGVDVESWIEVLLASNTISDGLLAQSHDEKRAVWEWRENITESLAKRGAVRKYDLSINLSRLESGLAEIEKLFKGSVMGADLYLFGHLADGSPHINLVLKEGYDKAVYEKECEAFEKKLFTILKDIGGSPSAEHGIGLLKKSWITLSRTQTELDWFRGIKQVFDPKGILNPGKIFD